MKISSQFLFELILELSKKDAASFLKKMNHNQMDDCSELFETIISNIDKKSSRNFAKFEKDLKLRLSNKVNKYYRLNKSKLKKELLSFLKDKNINNDPRYLIRENVDTGVALAELNHIEEGLSMILAAKEEAIKEEFFEEVIYALDKVRTYDFSLRKNNKNALAFNNEMSHYQNLLQNLNQFISLSFYIFSFQGDFGANKEVVNKLKRNKLLSDEKKALSLAAKKFFYLSWLDIYNVEKDYENMYKLVLNAVEYAKHATSINKLYARTLILMYGRLEFTTNNLEKYDENLKAIELIENFDTPKMYENNSFFYRIKNISVKIRRISNYANTQNPKLYSYCKEVETFLDETKISVYDKSFLYYSLIFNNTVKLQAHKDSCTLGKKYVKHVLSNLKQINPNDNQTIQCFLCYLLSAYVNYTEETFKYLFEHLFKKKNAQYFVGKDAPFAYVYKLHNVLMKAYLYGFYSKEVLSSYYDIWNEYPDFLLKANCIPKSVLDKSYNPALVENVSSKYAEVKFEC